MNCGWHAACLQHIFPCLSAITGSQFARVVASLPRLPLSDAHSELAGRQREQNRERQGRFRERHDQVENGASLDIHDDEPTVAASDGGQKKVAVAVKATRSAHERTPTPMSEDDDDPRDVRALSGSLAPASPKVLLLHPTNSIAALSLFVT